jgi:hypothetical protein
MVVRLFGQGVGSGLKITHLSFFTQKALAGNLVSRQCRNSCRGSAGEAEAEAEGFVHTPSPPDNSIRQT